MRASTPRSAKVRCSSTTSGNRRMRLPAGSPHRPRRPIPETFMRSGREPPRWPVLALIALLVAAGFLLTLFVFYPGIMTYDARYVYEAIAQRRVGDWQSPAMTALWALVDPIAPGSAS